MIAQHMQHRPEHLALDVGDLAHFDQRRRDERAACGVVAQRRLSDLVAAAAHRLDVGRDRVARLRGDDRADVDRELARIADLELGHRALQHREHAVGDVVLQAEDAQRRTALAGRIEGRRQDVDDDLLGERRGIDDHRVEAAGLGDEGERRAAARKAARELLFDEPRDRRRAGEDDALDAAVGDQRRADFAGARHELQHVARNASLMQQRARPRRRSAASPRPAWR